MLSLNNKYRAVVTLDASNPTEGGTRIVEFEDEGTQNCIWMLINQLKIF